MPLKLVVIESSFGHALTVDTTFEEPQKYIEDAESWTRKYKNLFNRDTYKLAQNSRRSPVYNYYLYEGKALHSYRYPYIGYADTAAKNKVVSEQVESYKKNVYNRAYDESFAECLSDIHKALENIDFIVYTTPVSEPMMKLLYDMGRMAAYERWLRELVSEFGVVYHFMYPNEITMDADSFNDAHHPTKDTSQKMVKILIGLRCNEVSNSMSKICMILCRDNIDQYINVLYEGFSRL